MPSGMNLHWVFLLLLQQTLGLSNDVHFIVYCYCLLLLFIVIVYYCYS